MYTRPGITQLPAAFCQDTLSKPQTRQMKTQSSHQQTRLPPHTDMPIRGEKKKKQTSKETSPYPTGIQAQVTPYIKLKQITD